MSKKTFVAFGADILAKLKEDASPLEGNNTTEKAKKADNQGEIASKEEVAKANAKANEDQDQVNDTIAKKEGKPTMKRKLKEQTDEFMDLIGSALAEADGELRINEKMKTYGEEEMGGGDDTFDFDDEEVEYDEEPTGGGGLEELVQQLSDVCAALSAEILGGGDEEEEESEGGYDDEELEGGYDDDMEDIPEEDAETVGTPLHGQTKGDNLKSKSHATGHRPSKTSGAATTTTQVTTTHGVKPTKGKKSKFEGERGHSKNIAHASKKNKVGDDIIA